MKSLAAFGFNNFDLGTVQLDLLRKPSYQREEPKKDRVDKLAANFILIAAGVLLVSFRERTFWIIDGQTRKIAAHRNGYTDLPAMILRGLTEKQEAELFLYQNRDRLAVNALSRHRAEVIAEDERAITIDEVLHANNLIASSTHDNGLRPMQAIAAAEFVFDLGGPELLDRTLSILDRALHQTLPIVRFRGTFVKGLGYFIIRDPWAANDSKIIKAVERAGANRLEEQSHHWKQAIGTKSSGSDSPKYMAHAFASLVYKGQAADWKPKRSS